MTARLPERPRFSVITVCYNSAETIAATLRSVNEQRWAEVEHIVIDGGSQDETLAIVAAVGKRVSSVISEPDEGIYDAMNKGIALATGDIIAFLNADDVYAHDGVLDRIAALMSEAELDVAYGDVTYFHARSPDVVTRYYDSGRFRPSRIGAGWMPAHPATFVRRAIFERFGRFRPEYRIAGDFEFVARTLSRPDVRHRHLPEVLARMRTGGVSNSTMAAKLRQNREVMRACRANGIRTSWLRLLGRYVVKVGELAGLPIRGGAR